MTAATQAVRRKTLVDAWADEALAEADAVEVRKVERAAAEAAAAAEIEVLTVEKDRLAEARLRAIGVAEAAAGELVLALGFVLEQAADERLVRGKLGVRQTEVHPVALEKRLSGYLGHALRRLVGPQAPRFGHLTLPKHFPMDGRTWVDDERFRTGLKMEREDENEA